MGRDEGDPYHLRSDPSVRPRHAVITALTEVQSTNSTDLEATLYDHVELDALDTLLSHRRGVDVSITFSVADVTVTVWVDDENHVVVEVAERTV